MISTIAQANVTKFGSFCFEKSTKQDRKFLTKAYELLEGVAGVY